MYECAAHLGLPYCVVRLLVGGGTLLTRDPPAMKLPDTRRIDESFAVLDLVESRGIRYTVAVNHFPRLAGVRAQGARPGPTHTG